MKKRVSFPISEEEHQALKMLAAKEKRRVKNLVIETLDAKFPNWRTGQTKNDNETAD